MLRRRGVPLWALSGGVAGAFLVLAQSMAGQTLTGLVLDRFGLGTGTRVPIRPLRALGAALAVVAVLVAGLGVHAVIPVSWLVILPLLAGAGTGWQAAVNGRLRQATGSTLIATLLNFSVGLAALTLTAAVAVLLTGMPTTWPANPLAYLGASPASPTFCWSPSWCARPGCFCSGCRPWPVSCSHQSCSTRSCRWGPALTRPC